MPIQSGPSRRQFLGGVCAAGFSALNFKAIQALAAGPGKSRVALTAGEDRADNVFRALASMKSEIRAAIGSRQIVIKPNNVSSTLQLAATHAQCLEGILEFLRSIGKREAVIAESAASAPAAVGYDNFKYTSLAGRYGVKFLDLDKEPFDLLYAVNEKDLHPNPVRMSRLLLNPGAFVISAAMPKTHDRVIATLSLKNIIVGAALKDPGFAWGQNRAPGARSDKGVCHGGGIRGINYNLFALASRLHPHLAVIDGYEGMEGNGPTGGTAVPHRVAVAALDWLAADRVTAELMGIDFSKIGYLNYCAAARLGEASLERIEIVGEALAPHVRKYRMHDHYEEQLQWT
jgi:uncharacterized protein (DUF362 family)